MAQDISLNLKGFGFSITRATDIDMNMYAGKCIISVVVKGNKSLLLHNVSFDILIK